MIPTKEELAAAIEEARQAGRQAAEKRLEYLKSIANPNKPLIDYCGGAWIFIKVDRRSKLGRFLGTMENAIPNCSIGAQSGGFGISIRGMNNGQEMSVASAAAHAALPVIEQALGVKGWVTEYMS